MADQNEELESSMTSEERKTRYRELLDQVKILQENEETCLETTSTLDEIIENVNLLFKDSTIKERIKHTDEVLLDARVVARASDVLLHITESIDCALDTYEHVELARKISSQLVDYDIPDEPDYVKLIKIAYNIMKPIPNFSFLYGELGITKSEKPVKEKKPKSQKSKKDMHATKKQPDKVTQVTKEEDSVDDTVKFLQWALLKEYEKSGKKHLNYFECLIDPSNFTASIENMFYCSFLVRDGKIKLDVDKDGVLEITPVSSQDLKTAKRNNMSYKQCITSIDMDEWQEIINAFKIKKCVLSKWRSKWQEGKN